MNTPRSTRRQLLEGTVGVALAGMAGCISGQGGLGAGQPAEDEHPGHADDEHGHEMVSEPKQSREVMVNTARGEDTTEYHFDPHVTWVSVGGTVKWELESGTHTATAYHPGNDQPRLVPEGSDAWDSGTMSEPGETFEHTFDTEGVYHYLCKPHEEFGMLATVVVGTPHAEDQRAVQAMPEDKPEAVHGKLEELNAMVREVMGDDHHDDEDGHDDDGEDGHDDGEDGHDDGEDGHHDDDETTTDEDDHDDDGEDGHHDDDETTTGEDGHDDDGEDGHHDDEDTHDDGEDGHHDDDETTTGEDGHDDDGEDGHHDDEDTATEESDHHDDETTTDEDHDGH